jgi:hypothetical protein
VGIEGIQRAVRATVAEPVLFPPPAGHPVDHARGGQLILAAGGEDVYLLSLVAAGDLPQVSTSPLCPPLAIVSVTRVSAIS